ncbi:hypothetical protein BpHYR1_049987 [Brachionus plicatilis]|uniref:Uncharacterized protein n=1 Tax=Brachionus plicatilis TaxID=10195 RepID=A0A3M7R6P0_BRAPC|nr:hypothetical protein BpHYR1_049987 [Brachionus plicatilis]
MAKFKRKKRELGLDLRLIRYNAAFVIVKNLNTANPRYNEQVGRKFRCSLYRNSLYRNCIEKDGQKNFFFQNMFVWYYIFQSQHFQY